MRIKTVIFISIFGLLLPNVIMAESSQALKQADLNEVVSSALAELERDGLFDGASAEKMANFEEFLAELMAADPGEELNLVQANADTWWPWSSSSAAANTQKAEKDAQNADSKAERVMTQVVDEGINSTSSTLLSWFDSIKNKAGQKVEDSKKAIIDRLKGLEAKIFAGVRARLEPTKDNVDAAATTIENLKIIIDKARALIDRAWQAFGGEIKK